MVEAGVAEVGVLADIRKTSEVGRAAPEEGAVAADDVVAIIICAPVGWKTNNYVISQ